MLKAIIFGAPGSGKGTYASQLQAKLNIEVIATGDIFRQITKENTPLSKKVKAYIEKGLLVPDNITTQILKQHLKKIPKEKGFILDGYPRTIEQAKTLEKITKINAIIQLIVPEQVIIERLSARRICQNCGAIYNLRFLKPKTDMKCDKCGGQLYQRPDDTPETIKKRIQIYEQQTQPILQYYKEKGTPIIQSKCESVDTPPETIVEEIHEKLKKLGLT